MDGMSHPCRETIGPLQPVNLRPASPGVRRLLLPVHFQLSDQRLIDGVII